MNFRATKIKLLLILLLFMTSVLVPMIALLSFLPNRWMTLAQISAASYLDKSKSKSDTDLLVLGDSSASRNFLRNNQSKRTLILAPWAASPYEVEVLLDHFRQKNNFQCVVTEMAYVPKTYYERAFWDVFVTTGYHDLKSVMNIAGNVFGMSKIDIVGSYLNYRYSLGPQVAERLRRLFQPGIYKSNMTFLLKMIKRGGNTAREDEWDGSKFDLGRYDLNKKFTPYPHFDRSLDSLVGKISSLPTASAAFVIPPHAYEKLDEEFYRREEELRYLKQLYYKLNVNVLEITFRRRLNRDDFFDPLHLNYQGAFRHTQIVMNKFRKKFDQATCY